MKRAIALTFAMGAALPATAETLPQSGQCLSPASGYIFDSVSWSPTGAEMDYLGQIVPAEVRGLRAHDDGFRLSIFANHPIVGAMEVAIFYLPDRDEPRIAAASYEQSEDGRVLSYVTGYEFTSCTFD